jgi:hypothetical protein
MDTTGKSVVPQMRTILSTCKNINIIWKKKHCICCNIMGFASYPQLYSFQGISFFNQDLILIQSVFVHDNLMLNEKKGIS